MKKMILVCLCLLSLLNIVEGKYEVTFKLSKEMQIVFDNERIATAERKMNEIQKHQLCKTIGDYSLFRRDCEIENYGQITLYDEKDNIIEKIYNEEGEQVAKIIIEVFEK